MLCISGSDAKSALIQGLISILIATALRTFASRIKLGVCIVNGTLQWALAITNEIERRYCPIQNQCHPHCEKAKGWRDAFLKYGHGVEEIDLYYENRYLQESMLDD